MQNKFYHDYIFYTTDESFDYWSPWGCTTEKVEIPHGFTIAVDSEDNPDFASLEGFGDYSEVNNLKSLEELKGYILEHINEIANGGDDPEIFLELVSFIDGRKKCA